MTLGITEIKNSMLMASLTLAGDSLEIGCKKGGENFWLVVHAHVGQLRQTRIDIDIFFIY